MRETCQETHCITASCTWECKRQLQIRAPMLTLVHCRKWESELDCGVMEEGGMNWWIRVSLASARCMCIIYFGKRRPQDLFWEDSKPEEKECCLGQWSAGKCWGSDVTLTCITSPNTVAYIPSLQSFFLWLFSGEYFTLSHCKRDSGFDFLDLNLIKQLSYVLEEQIQSMDRPLSAADGQ